VSASTTFWRIATDTPLYEAHDLTGKGAEISGGRWNRVGTPMIYASTSRALACLETVVHLSDRPLPLNRYLVELSVPMKAWEEASDVNPDTLVGWDAEPVGKASLDWATAWSRAKASLLARVPSIIVLEEFNVLINPLHPEARLLRSRKVRKWTYDSRLAR